jgi:hypothetical protein
MENKYDVRSPVLKVSITLLLCIHTVCAQAPGYPLFYTEKIFAVPDLIQTDKGANFPGGGTEYCCLVAIGNSLMWLSSNGFPNLVKRTGTQFDDEVALVKLLGSKAYMDTSIDEGTGTINIMRGLTKYIRDRGYDINRLEYRGWRKRPAQLTAEHPVPELQWIKQNILGKESVWLNIGWYKHDPSHNEYRRIAGHWVTVVGYGKNEGGDTDSRILIFHDPSPRTGHHSPNEYASVMTLDAGTLTGDFGGLPRSAAGYSTLGGGMHIKSGADTGIIDGALALALAPEPRGKEDTGEAAANQVTMHSIGKGIMLKEQPRDAPAPNINLSRNERLENFDILAEAIDKNYSFFVHKNINWPEVTAQYRRKVGMAVSDDDFYLVLYEFVRELKDFHSWLCNYKHVPELG